MKSLELNLIEESNLRSRFLILFHFIIAFFLFTNIFAQSEIGLIIPNQGLAGTKNMIISIRGNGTNFKDRLTTVSFEPTNSGIKVNSILVQDPSSLSLNVDISPTAVAGMKRLVIQTGAEKVILNDAFEVQATGNGIYAQLEVIPVQSLSIGDFDKRNLATAPVLFNVRVFNENVSHNLTARFIFSTKKYGKIGTADKFLKNVIPNAIISFNNREFEKYDVSKSSSQFIDEVMSSGSLPSDDYFYKLLVYDEKGKIVAEADGSNTVTNSITGLNLIAPGNSTNENPEIIKNKFPQFQWFSQATSFDFSLWKLDKNAILPSDLAARLPIYSQKNIFSNQLIYPNSARLLEEGATYAWQITGYINDSKGKKAIKSEIFWFSVVNTDANYTRIDKIEMVPADMTLSYNDTLTFRIHALNEKAESITIKPQWKVVPASAGKITSEGKFTAGNKPISAAVIASLNGVEEYATIKIVPTLSGNWSFDDFFKKVFGLPESKK